MRKPNPILIVEDDLDTRQAMQALLEMHGYLVVPAANGAEGLDQLYGGLRPCLILLDLKMPVKNGFEFLAERCRDPVLADIPVVVCSGDINEAGHESVRGAAAHLCKPLNVDRLLELIRAHSLERPPIDASRTALKSS